MKQSRGRRISPAAPQKSLLLRKATLEIKHGGGTRFAVGSYAYDVLRRWIAQGSPGPHEDEPRLVRLIVRPAEISLQVKTAQKMSVQASWSDGSSANVTQFARFEVDDTEVANVQPKTRDQIVASTPGRTLLRVHYLDQVAVVRVAVPFGQGANKEANNRKVEKSEKMPPPFEPLNFIDTLAQKEWKALGLQPVGPTGDANFLRRATLHIVGRLPTPREVRRFLGSLDKQKRVKLIDRLLARPEYARQWSEVWGEWLLADSKGLKKKEQALAADQWLKAAMEDNRPLNRLVRDVLTARGDPRKNGAVTFYAAHASNEQVVRTVSRIFLGADLNCAKCHRHPRQSWTREDYLALAQCFAPIRIAKNKTGGEILVVDASVRLKHPETGSPITAAIFGHPLEPMKPLDPTKPAVDARVNLANWLNGEGKLLLARNLVNRYWKHLFGHGFVEKNADLRTSVEAVHRQLFDALAADLIAHHFDAKHLLRTICTSRLYQLDVTGASPSFVDRRFHSRFQPYRIGELLLWRIQGQATQSDWFSATDAKGVPRYLLPAYAYNSSAFSGRPRSGCTRESKHNLPQPQILHHDNGMLKVITDPRGRLARMLATGWTDQRIVDELFLAILIRPPTPSERDMVRKHLKKQQGPKTTLAKARAICYEDVMWSLMNTKEFLLIR